MYFIRALELLVNSKQFQLKQLVIQMLSTLLNNVSIK